MYFLQPSLNLIFKLCHSQGGKPVVDSLLEHGSGDPLVAVINTWELPKNVTPQIFASNMLKVENRPNDVSTESTTSLISRKRPTEDTPTSAQKKSLSVPNTFEMEESDKSSEMNAIHPLEQYETDLTTLSEERSTLRSDETADIMDFLRGQRCVSIMTPPKFIKVTTIYFFTRNRLTRDSLVTLQGVCEVKYNVDSNCSTIFTCEILYYCCIRFIARSSQRGRCSFSKPQMVTRRLVYCNQTGENNQGKPETKLSENDLRKLKPSKIDLGLPKLALFANVDICAGSEIIM